MTQQDTPSKKLHVAIIMDGNGRWAGGRNLPRTMGHKAGIDAVRRTLEAARHLPISHLTLYSFSSENWRRPAEEVSELMGLLRFYLRSELNNFQKEGVCIKVIGERDLLPKDIAEQISQAEEMTKDNKELTLTLALSYGGRQEITAAVRAIAVAVEKKELSACDINENLVQSHLYTSDIKDPDLVIRTSGEKRISNFLLWQSAYAEYFFLDVLWPDFSGEHLKEAIDEFQRRERRYGATSGDA